MRAWQLAWQREGEAEVHEHCTVVDLGAGLSLTGVVLGVEGRHPVHVEYSVRTDADGFTRGTRVRDVHGYGSRQIVLARDPKGCWTVDGDVVHALEGCTDVDLGCSPATNALPVRRLGLEVGASCEIEVAWLRFPQLVVARAVQSYQRLDSYRYRYASGGFEAEMTVDDDGFVIRYDEWSRTRAGSLRR
jgi:hypothetical protein